MRKTLGLVALALILSAARATPAFADVNAFLLVPGVPGGSTDARHVGWIDVLSVRQTLTPTKKGSACQVEIVKPLDIAGPRLWLAAVTGQTFAEVRIEVVKAAADPFKVYEIRLANAIVSSISTAAGPGDVLRESLVWEAPSATLTFFTQNPDGSPGASVTSTIVCN
jgi:type VI protein secretion system component Hcp